MAIKPMNVNNEHTSLATREIRNTGDMSIHKLLCLQVQLQETYGDMFVKNPISCRMVTPYDLTHLYNEMCATRDTLIKLNAFAFLVVGSLVLFGLVTAGMQCDFVFDDLPDYICQAIVNMTIGVIIFSLLTIALAFDYVSGGFTEMGDYQ